MAYTIWQYMLTMVINTFPSHVDSFAYRNAHSRLSAYDIDAAWRHRQIIKRGVVKKVNLLHGHFICEFPVPTPILSAVEGRYAQTKTTEFS
jgi:hypothetical protein